MTSQTPDQTVLVVGANRGIGYGFVQQLLPQASQIYATYRQIASPELTELAAQSPQLHLLPMDITDEAQISSGLAQIRRQVERLHLVIYCVGFLHEGEIQPEKSLQQIQPAHLLRYFEVNSIGAVLLAKHLIPLLKHPERSVLACISAKIGSITDNQSGGWYGYRASKAALNMLMRTAALEYSRKSPKTIVAMLHPGTTDTRLSAPFQRGLLPDKLFSVERTVQQLLAVMDGLQPEQSGEFFTWDGSPLPF
ncbi:MAG: SDR family NAD(P)-dependent oxidoreductase [Pegethrix bostrychoides GSE-TBD4-15B]|jgi:NAD(P)-dependent dehydrogenase (short-subunit alcohol dehydrogenase family)|uniref:SDR family NAD(P)-dependent oxidoreductase n=1 Tax=Pegethrix bostrychoides GSE-TBD4-15B TaxID=2839662 RepID=A0A951P7N3_9CYAN|nr:SDR family NAD(P)-dependent oxidoreductase [Pegethrix bostrychoides GSE-TBD4-15B]